MTCDICGGAGRVRTGPAGPSACPACDGTGSRPPDAPAYPRYRWVTYHRTSGEARQLVVEPRPGVVRLVGGEVPVGPQGPTSGQIIKAAGFYSDGRPTPGGGQEVVLPLPRPDYPVDTSGPSLSQLHGLDSPGAFSSTIAAPVYPPPTQ